MTNIHIILLMQCPITYPYWLWVSCPYQGPSFNWWLIYRSNLRIFTKIPSAFSSVSILIYSIWRPSGYHLTLKLNNWKDLSEILLNSFGLQSVWVWFSAQIPFCVSALNFMPIRIPRRSLKGFYYCMDKSYEFWSFDIW